MLGRMKVNVFLSLFPLAHPSLPAKHGQKEEKLCQALCNQLVFLRVYSSSSRPYTRRELGEHRGPLPGDAWLSCLVADLWVVVFLNVTREVG